LLPDVRDGALTALDAVESEAAVALHETRPSRNGEMGRGTADGNEIRGRGSG